MDKMMAKWGGGEVLRRSVRGMLPKNRLRDERMARLKCKWKHTMATWMVKADWVHCDRLRRTCTSIQAESATDASRPDRTAAGSAENPQDTNTICTDINIDAGNEHDISTMIEIYISKERGVHISLRLYRVRKRNCMEFKAGYRRLSIIRETVRYIQTNAGRRRILPSNTKQIITLSRCSQPPSL